MVFVSLVSPTTTVCGSFVGAVGGGGGGAASSVVLQFIVRTCYPWYHFFIPGLSSPVQKTHSGHEKLQYHDVYMWYGYPVLKVRTEESNRMNTHTCLSCIKQDTGISHT